MQKVVFLMKKKLNQTNLPNETCFFLLVQIKIAALPIFSNSISF